MTWRGASSLPPWQRGHVAAVRPTHERTVVDLEERNGYGDAVCRCDGPLRAGDAVVVRDAVKRCRWRAAVTVSSVPGDVGGRWWCQVRLDESHPLPWVDEKEVA